MGRYEECFLPPSCVRCGKSVAGCRRVRRSCIVGTRIEGSCCFCLPVGRRERVSNDSTERPSWNGPFITTYLRVEHGRVVWTKAHQQGVLLWRRCFVSHVENVFLFLIIRKHVFMVSFVIHGCSSNSTSTRIAPAWSTSPKDKASWSSTMERFSPPLLDGAGLGFQPSQRRDVISENER